MKKSIILAAFIFLAILFFPPQKVFASCTNDTPFKCNTNSVESCVNQGNGTSAGTAVYGCGTYIDGTYCWCQTYSCTTSCGGGGTCGGGAGQCSGICSTGTCNHGADGTKPCGCHGGGGPSCNATNPTNLVGSCVGTAATVSWTASTCANSYNLRIDDTANSFICSPLNPGDFCGNIDSTSYTFTGVSGHTYNWWVHGQKGDVSSGVSGPSFTCAPINGVCNALHYNCDSGTLGFTAEYPNATYPNVPPSYQWWCNGSGGGANVLCTEWKPINGVCNATHNNCNAGTLGATAEYSNNWQWWCNGLYGGFNTWCVEMKPSVGWWQVKDADIASNGDVISKAPSGIKFSLDGPGGFPGVVSYGGTASFKFGGGTAGFSTKNWLANTVINTSKVYDYDYFVSKIPSDVTPTVVNSVDVVAKITGDTTQLKYGYYWYEYDGSALGDLTIGNNVSLGDRKVILIVKSANLKIAGNINLNTGSGFFMVIVNGNINVNPNFVKGGTGVAPNLEGIYLADGVFKTGTGGARNDGRLYIRGSVVGYGGVTLERDLGDISNLTTPAETFEYAPDQVLLFPSVFGTRRMNWKEIAP